jgi:hypothetical protein
MTCIDRLSPADAPFCTICIDVAFAAMSEPALNERDVLQNHTSKLDLGLQRVDILPQGGCLYETVEIVLKATKREFDGA